MICVNKDVKSENNQIEELLKSSFKISDNIKIDQCLLLHTKQTDVKLSECMKGVCSDCLALKFGLTECFNYFHELKENEGPYLRVETLKDVDDCINVCFPKNCIIFPTGELLYDVLLSDKISYNPTIVLNEETYTINNYLLQYFMKLKTTSLHKNTRNILDSVFNPLKCFITYENEAHIISQFVKPTASNSFKILNNEMLPNDVINVKLTAIADVLNEDYSSYLNSFVKTEIECGNLKVKKNTLFMYHQNEPNLHSEHSLLKKLFPKIKSLTGLNFAYYCVPFCILDNDKKAIRQLLPNVTWIEGLGLVSKTELNNNEFLVIDQTVDCIDLFKILKLNPIPKNTAL